VHQLSWKWKFSILPPLNFTFCKKYRHRRCGPNCLLSADMKKNINKIQQVIYDIRPYFLLAYPLHNDGLVCRRQTHFPAFCCISGKGCDAVFQNLRNSTN